MRNKLDLSFTAAQLAAPGTVKHDPQEPGYDGATFVTIVAQLTGLTGGTLDVTIQDSPDGVTWVDLVRFAQVVAGATVATFAYNPALNDKIVQIGTTTDPATPVPVLAVNSARGGHPRGYLRAVAVAGAGASAGAAQTITVFAR